MTIAWHFLFIFSPRGFVYTLPFDSAHVCVCLQRCLWGRWLWLHDDNTLCGCPKSIKSKPKCLPRISTGHLKGWYWLFHPFLAFGRPDERDRSRRGEMIMQLLGGGSLCTPAVMFSESGSWMSEKNRCVMINMASSQEPNACQNTHVRLSNGL